jgi:O-antigen/teichoic acid export membrane protein
MPVGEVTETTNVKKPGRGTVQLLVARGIFLVCGFAISVILARGLGPEEFGVYGVVMSVLVWLERVLSAGIPGATATLIPRHELQREVIEQSARVLLMVWALPLFALVWMIAPTLANYFEILSGSTLFRVAALNIPAMGLFFAYEGIFSGRRLFGAQASLLIVQSVTKFAGILVLLVIGLSVIGAFVAHVAATLATILFIALAFPPSRPLPSKAVMQSMVRIALPMGIYVVALAILTNLSLWQLKGVTAVGGEDVGLYVAGVSLTRIFVMVPSTISGVLYASLTWAIATSQHALVKRYIQEAVRFAWVTTVPACVLLYVDAESVMQMLFGAKYAAGGTVLGILCIAFSAMALLDILFHALMADGLFVLSASILGALLPVLIALNLVLIPSQGGVGAATASMIVLCVGTVIGAALAYKRFGNPIRWMTVWRVAGASLAVGAISTQLSVTGPWLVIKLGGLGLLYLLILWWGGELSKHDLKPFALWKPEKS